jgi:hypothetical protein
MEVEEMRNELARAIKKVAILILALIVPANCLAAEKILISEVLYDPLSTDTGGEAVELYNPTDTAIDISGYTLKTEASASDATIPANTVLGAGRYYLIADTGWKTLKDNASYPDADHEEAITMANTDSGVAIAMPNGTTVDSVGWGNAAGINAGLYEGMPAVQAAAGKSLKRNTAATDTDENSADFSEAEPELTNSTQPTEGGETGNATGEEIELAISVTNNAPQVGSVDIGEDEDDAAGVQVMPVPEGGKNVTITAEISDADGAGNLNVTAKINGAGLEKEVIINLVSTDGNTSSTYAGYAIMEFYDSPGEYNATVTADDGAISANGSATFEYLPMTAISIDTTALQFPEAIIGAITGIDGDYALSTSDAPTIRNSGNTPLDIGVYGTDLTDGQKSIDAGNIKYGFENDFAGELSGTVGGSMQVTALGLLNGADSVVSLGFRLNIPPTTQNGNYTGRVTVVAITG